MNMINFANAVGLTTRESIIFGNKDTDKSGDKLLLVYKKTDKYNNDTFKNFNSDVFQQCKLFNIFITSKTDADDYDKIDMTTYINNNKINSYPLIDKNIIIDNSKIINEEGNEEGNELESYEKTLEYFLKFKLKNDNYSYKHITDACNERNYYIAYKIEKVDADNYNLSECKFSSCIYAEQRPSPPKFIINSISKSDSLLINKFNSDIKTSLEELKKLKGGKPRKSKTHRKPKNKKRKTNKHKKI